MKRVWHIAWQDIRITVSHKVFFFWTLAFPVFFIMIFGNMFQAADRDIKAALTVFNQDQGPWGDYLVSRLKGRGMEIDLARQFPATYFRVLEIPADFSRKIETGTAQKLPFKVKADVNFKATMAARVRLIQSLTRVLTEIVLYGDKDRTKFFANKPEFRDLIVLKSQYPPNTLEKVPSGFDHAIPGAITQFIMMMLMIYGGITVMEDRRRKLLTRMLYSRLSQGELFLGKFLGRWLIGLLQAFMLILIGKLFFRLSLGNTFLALLTILIFSGAMAAFSIFLGSVLTKEDLIVGVAILASNVFSALGGCWWPIEIVPPLFKKIGMISPAYWAMDSFHQLIFFKKGFSDIGLNLIIIAAYGIVFTICAIRFFRVRD